MSQRPRLIRRRPRQAVSTSQLTILQAMEDPHLFGQFFRREEDWAAWKAYLSALFALPMTSEQLATFRECTGRQAPPTSPCTESWLICGRRAGKSYTLSLVATYLATFKDWRPYLGPGELGTIMLIAADKKQARVCLRYIKGLLASVPMLKRMIIAETAEVSNVE